MILNLKIGPELRELLTFENETFSENKIIAKSSCFGHTDMEEACQG